MTVVNRDDGCRQNQLSNSFMPVSIITTTEDRERDSEGERWS